MNIRLNKIKKRSSLRFEYLENDDIFSGIEDLDGVLGEIDLSQVGNPSIIVSLRNRVAKMRSTLDYMMDYMIGGASDTGRQGVLNGVRNDFLDVWDLLLRFARIVGDSGSAISVRSMDYDRAGNGLCSLIDDYLRVSSVYSIMGETGDFSFEMAENHERSLRELFYGVLVSDVIGKSDYDRILQLVLDDNAEFVMRAQVISALYLSLMFGYSSSKMQMLLDIYNGTNDERLAARSMVGIVLAMRENPRRVLFDEEVISKLSLWKDSIVAYSRYSEVIQGLVRQKGTPVLQDYFRRNIFPTLSKIAPKVKDILKDGEESEQAAERLEDAASAAGLDEKMRELMEMQVKGGDLFYGMFKTNDTFHNELSNALIPFDINNSEVRRKASSYLDFVRLITSDDKNKMFCDCDKYSLVFMLSNDPQMRGMLQNGMLDQVRQMNEDFNSDMKMREPNFSAELVCFIKDLYRFYESILRRNNLGLPVDGKYKPKISNPFASDIFAEDTPLVSDILCDDSLREHVYDSYFSYNTETALFGVNFEDSLKYGWTVSDIKESGKRLLYKIGERYEKLFVEAPLITENEVEQMWKSSECFFRAGDIQRAFKNSMRLYDTMHRGDAMRLRALEMILTIWNRSILKGVDIEESFLPPDIDMEEVSGNMGLMSLAAEFYCLGNDYANAKKFAYGSYYLEPSAEMSSLLGIIHISEWEMEKGRAMLESVLSQAVDDSMLEAETEFRLGLSYMFEGKAREGREHFRKSRKVLSDEKVYVDIRRRYLPLVREMLYSESDYNLLSTY